MPDIKKLKTPDVAVFINTGASETPVWKRAGQGVTTLGINYNPQTTTEQYIHENSATTSTDSYQVALDVPLTCFANEPIFEYIDNIRRTRGIGSDAETEALIVYIYDSTGEGSSATYAAERNKASLAVNDFGGDAGAPVVLNSSLSLNGDPVLGTVAITDGAPVFTAA